MTRKLFCINILIFNLVFFIVVTILLQGCSNSPRQGSGNLEKQVPPPSGLLLGISTTDKAYHTMYITYKNNSVSLVKSGSGLLIPRDDGFWMIRQNHIDLKDTYQELSLTFAADYLDVRKAGADAPQPHIEPGQMAQRYYRQGYSNSSKLPYNSQTLLNIAFVGNNHLTLWMDSYGFTGGAHPYTSRSLNTYAIDDLTKSNVKDVNPSFNQGLYDNRLSLSKFFGSTAQTTLEDSAQKYLSDNPDKAKVLERKIFRDTGWGLSRKEGHWKIEGILGPRDQVVREQFALFNTDLKPPKELVSHDELVADWKTIVAKMPSAEDAISSPENNILVVFTKEKMVFYKVTGSAIGDAVGEIALTAYDKPRVVMIQWCTGGYVDKWADEARKYLK
jgi:hypothetical protein